MESLASKLKDAAVVFTTMNESKLEMLASMSELLASGNYSDLTITCPGFTWSVHRAIVCPRSKVFKRMLEGSFKESETGVIDLPEEDPSAVLSMILFLYKHSYACGKPDDSKGQSLTFLPQEEEHECVQHAKVYTLADRYEILDLKKLALARFKAAQRKKPWDKMSMLAVAREAYEKTMASDRGLKEAVVDVFYQRKVFIRQNFWKKDMEDMSELLYDLLTRPLTRSLFTRPLYLYDPNNVAEGKAGDAQYSNYNDDIDNGDVDDGDVGNVDVDNGDDVDNEDDGNDDNNSDDIDNEGVDNDDNNDDNDDEDVDNLDNLDVNNLDNLDVGNHDVDNHDFGNHDVEHHDNDDNDDNDNYYDDNDDYDSYYDDNDDHDSYYDDNDDNDNYYNNDDDFF